MIGGVEIAHDLDLRCHNALQDELSNTMTTGNDKVLIVVVEDKCFHTATITGIDGWRQC
jgi:hypothetical protein